MYDGVSLSPSDVNAPGLKTTVEFAQPQLPSVATTPGWKTTEFWISVLVILMLFASDIAELLPADLSAKLMVIVAAVYKVLRVLLKWRNGRQSVDAAKLLAEMPPTAIVSTPVATEGGAK